MHFLGLSVLGFAHGPSCRGSSGRQESPPDFENGQAIVNALSTFRPLRAHPEDCMLEFENRQVREIRVRMGPRRTAPLDEYVPNHAGVV